MGKPFHYFNTNWCSEVNKRPGPWYIASVDRQLWDFGYDDPGLTLTGCEVALWLTINAPKVRVFVNEERSNSYYFFFSDRTIAAKFNKWWKSNSLAELGDYKRKHLVWPDKLNFDKELIENGNIIVKANFSFPLKEYDPHENINDRNSDSNFYITERVLEMFIWCRQNIKGKMWRWNKTFYFEREDDAVAFKLRFIGEQDQNA